MADLAAFALKLGLKRSGAGYRGPCPVHGGKTSPFALTSGAGGRLLVHCHAGCDAADILTTLRRTLILPKESAPTPRATPRPPRAVTSRGSEAGIGVDATEFRTRNEAAPY